jgi:phosphotransferase system enzyme I (PtsI)
VVLLGLGYENFSMSATSLLRVKSMLLNITRKEARELVRRALRMSDAESISQFITDSLGKPEIARLIRPTKRSEKVRSLKD